MVLLNWMGEHPTLTVVLAFIAAGTIIDTANAIGRGFFKDNCTCQCSKPSEPAERSSKPEQHSRSASAMRPDIGQEGRK